MNRLRRIIGDDRSLHRRTGRMNGEKIFTDDVWGNNFRKWKVKTHDATGARWCVFDELIEGIPISIGMLVAYLLAGQGTILVA